MKTLANTNFACYGASRNNICAASFDAEGRALEVVTDANELWFIENTDPLQVAQWGRDTFGGDAMIVNGKLELPQSWLDAYAAHKIAQTEPCEEYFVPALVA